MNKIVEGLIESTVLFVRSYVKDFISKKKT